ncbi:maleylpyruvate isomerase family mycothiol-dependent enzyme [Pseudarthrobacter niigatensis]|uniref:Maleylpyruvate isomerase n=1 Tax=Pseudarthrobacter niigatensis TaxID=369935 RepID=A0AAJ1SU85_9MICC|nr:maleylpyruvate isomerase family mycothiol-dependent enzyme [Pseudarthrobacter niigatensis]MDQ0146484.1 maleylpyruvate isomerase [Pseudarthrobacter niigatensis]MDQ0265034.1 maleylpyruvate isomerase [Pseudarthrobacter niigatensis]
MTSPSPAALPAELHKAADALTAAVDRIPAGGEKASSTLPGWSRGHLLAHVAGICNALARQVEYGRRGETVELYDGGVDGRNRAIELAAGHSLEDHREDVAAAVQRALAAFDALGEDEWQTRIAFRDGVIFDAGLALWRELVIHTADLDTGSGPETWNRAFCSHLFDFLAARVPAETRLVLQPMALPPLTLGTGGSTVVVSGMVTDIAAWLAGREPSLDSLRATAAGDGTDLPGLLPWPSAIPDPK